MVKTIIAGPETIEPGTTATVWTPSTLDLKTTITGKIAKPSVQTVSWNPDEFEIININTQKGLIELKRKDA